MTKNRIISIISLLLVAIMALSACSSTPETPDAPITAEGILSNFMTFEEPEVKPLNNASSLTEELGEVMDFDKDFSIFHKETKDRFNNLTETYSIYSIEEKRVVGTVSNTYADEWGWADDFGNKTYPEKSITDYDIVKVYDITYFVFEWTAYTPIDEEIIEEEELTWSYTEDVYYEFYDATGALIATSRVENQGEYVTSNKYYTLVSFGKTVAVFDNEENKVVSTYDGDVEATPILYDYMNDEYNYLLNVPDGIAGGMADPSLIGNRTKIMVFDKENNLVLEYAHGDYPMMVRSFVLDSGDVLIQHMVATDEIDYDIYADGMKCNLDTFLLDVETGVVTELPEFGYAVSDVFFAEEFLENAPDGIATTENVRNMAYAQSLADEKEYTVFFDNFGNVNFVFDGKLSYEMDSEEFYRVLSDDRLLITLASGVTTQAVIDNAGNVVAYIPDDAIILRDYIVIGEDGGDISIYDFDMKLVDTITDSWADSYDDEGETVNYHGYIGNTLVFTAYNIKTSNSGTEYTPYVIMIDVKNDTVRHYSESYIDIDGFDLLIIKKTGKNIHTPIFTVINENGKAVLTVAANSCHVASFCDEAVIIEFDTADGYHPYLIDNTGIEHDYDDDGDKDDGDKDDGDKDDGDKDDEGGKD